MAEIKYDVLGIGNAIVDVLAPTDDAFLEEFGMVKGSMALIDAQKAEEIYAAMSSGTESSGGSAANTVAGVAALGWFRAKINAQTSNIISKCSTQLVIPYLADETGSTAQGGYSGYSIGSRPARRLSS